MKFLCHRLGPASRGIWTASRTAANPLLAVGTQRSEIHKYFIVVDKHAIPCKSPDSLACFDELFKAHFVFCTSYNKDLANVYNFLQTTIYEIDVATTKVNPRVAELRARMLHWVDTEMCFICKSPQANANSLTKHFKLIHGLCSGKTLHLVVRLLVHKFMALFLGLESISIKHMNLVLILVKAPLQLKI